MSSFIFANSVLDGKFLTLGSKWLSPPDGMNRSTILDEIFPLVSRCHVNIWGEGSKLETINLKCILSPNAITRYVFLIMWFLFVILLVINPLNVLLNIGMMGHSYRLRVLYLKRAMGSTKVSNQLFCYCYQGLKLQYIRLSKTSQCL